MKSSTYYTLLLRSLDESLSPEEEQQLAEALEKFPDLQKEKTELEEMRRMLQGQELRFSPFFASRLMNRLQSRGQKVRESWLTQMSFAFHRVSIPAFAVAGLLLLTTFLVEQSLSLDVLIGTSELTVDDMMTGVISSF